MSRERSTSELGEIRKVARENIEESRRLAQEARRIVAESKEVVERLKRQRAFWPEIK
jgi:hypothetical protein